MGREWHRRLDVALANAVPIVLVLGYVVWQAISRHGIDLKRGSVSSQARDVLWFSLLSGLATYATIETLKRVFRVRGLYQRWQTERRLEATDPNAYQQLLDALGLRRDDELRVFNLPTEQLTAQIGTAADLALTNPRDLSGLVKGLGGPLPEELEAYVSAGNTKEPRNDLRLQLAQRMQLGIDRLQISLSEQWRRTIQGAALWISGIYGIGMIHAAHLTDEPRYVFAAVLFGGPLAWLFRDFAAVIERARR